MRPQENRERGAAFVEFSITVLLFIALMIVTTDVMRYALQTIKAQYTVDFALRRIILGQPVTSDGVITGRQAWPSVATVKAEIVQHAARFNMDLSDAAIAASGGAAKLHVCSGQSVATNGCTVCSGTPTVCNPVDSVGQGRDLTIIQLEVPFTFFLWGGSYPVRATAIGRNEPF